MGFIRFLLALAVAIGHIKVFYPSFENHVLAGQTAVQSFFVVSGFYMALILNTKYHSIWVFYFNRFLRLFPLYWCVLIFTFLGAHVTGVPDFVSTILFQPSLTSETRIYIFVTSAFLLGSDFAYFLKQTPHGLEFTSAYFVSDHAPVLWSLFPNPPSWTLSLELYFYLIAPFLVRRVSTIITFALLCVLIRLLFNIAISYSEPWTYRFFPFELGLFMLGALAYKFSEKFDLMKFGKIAVFGTVAMIAIVPLLHVSFIFKNVLFIGVLLFALPSVFQFSRASRFDRAIGELSYPIYIVHYPILHLVSMSQISLPYKGLAFPLVFIATALMVQTFIQNPIERKFKRSL